MSPLFLLSAIVFLPVFGAILVAFIPSDKPDALKLTTFGITALVLILAIAGFFANDATQFDVAQASMQHTFNVDWIPSFDIYYALGVDGISLPLVILTALVMMLSMGASWSIDKHVKAYCVLFLILETGIMGVFLALDFFLFYVFWEVMLLPMYFLIGVWGGPRREYAAIKFFLYTLAGGVLMLIAVLMLYFAGDIRGLANVAFDPEHKFNQMNWESLNISPGVNQQIGLAVTDPNKNVIEESQVRDQAAIAFLRQDAATQDKALAIQFKSDGEADGVATTYDEAAHAVTVHVAPGKSTAAEVVKAINDNAAVAAVVRAKLPPGSEGTDPVADEDSLTLGAFSPGTTHTFNLLALAAIGQHTDQFNVHYLKDSWLEGTWLDQSLQWWAFLLLFIGFIIKVPSVPVHTWLPDAHVEAPTPISMILAGVLLKLGGYGIIRICYPICPAGGYEMMYFVCGLGVISMVYGAFAALAQKDFKRLVAYSSVSHMGYVVLGLGVWSATLANGFDPYYWNMGVKGAMFQMIGHGISSPGMFFMVGIIYERVHHRNLNEFGGLFDKMPMYTAMAMTIFFAGLGLPGLCGFIGEVLVVLSVWKFSHLLAIVSAFVVILTAGYILWAIQRVYLGAEYKGPHPEALKDVNLRAAAIGGVIVILCVVLGVWPWQTVLKFMDASVDAQVNGLTAWTKNVWDVQPLAVQRDADEPATAGLPVDDRVSLIVD